MHLIVTVRRALWSDSCASRFVPNPLESRALQNWRSWVFEKTQILLDLPHNSQDSLIFRTRSLVVCSRGRGEAIPQVSSIFMVVWLRFIVWIQVFGGFLDATGQLVSEQSRPVRPVQCTGQTGPGSSVLRFLSIRFRFALWFRSLVRGLLCWFSFSIAIPNFGQNAWGLG